jgi:hypothetical protein
MPSGKKTAVGGVLGSNASGEEQCGAEQDEGSDHGDLNHGEPEFETRIAADTEKVDGEQEKRKDKNPEDRGDVGEPELHIGGRGDHLGADGEGENEPVSGAGNKSGIAVEVEISIDAKGTGGGMSAGEFAKRKRDGPTDKGSEDEAEDNGGSGEFDGGGRAEEQSGADGAADGDHRHLSGGEVVAKPGLRVRGRGGHEASYCISEAGPSAGKDSRGTGGAPVAPLFIHRLYRGKHGPSASHDFRNRTTGEPRCWCLGPILELRRNLCRTTAHAGKS